jgi:hypothetical protein
MKLKLLGLIAAVSLLGFSPASADAIYTYTGSDFGPTSGPYTTTDMVTGTIDLATALGDNLGLSSILPDSFSFSDGVQTITSSDSLSKESFNVATDANGYIVAWSIILETDVSDGISSNFNPGFVVPGDIAYLNGGSDGAAVTLTPGSWTPLPAALPLFATGLGAMGLLGWRRKRKNAALAAA